VARAAPAAPAAKPAPAAAAVIEKTKVEAPVPRLQGALGRLSPAAERRTSPVTTHRARPRSCGSLAMCQRRTAPCSCCCSPTVPPPPPLPQARRPRPPPWSPTSFGRCWRCGGWRQRCTTLWQRRCRSVSQQGRPPGGAPTRAALRPALQLAPPSAACLSRSAALSSTSSGRAGWPATPPNPPTHRAPTHPPKHTHAPPPPLARAGSGPGVQRRCHGRAARRDGLATRAVRPAIRQPHTLP
jgi:hypothetical protein